MKKILVMGACGQIGSEVMELFRDRYGSDNVVGMDVKPSANGPHEVLDALDREGLTGVIQKHRIDTVLHLVAVLSATGEKNPEVAWSVNMDTLRNVLDLAREHRLRVFWPSSIAVFGANCPHNLTPQTPPLLPKTMYGITKVAGELLCNYYFQKYGVDVRSVRYPGLISYKTPPGGGTTDYAVEIFYHALEKASYECFLKPATRLPMMYMEDGLRAIVDLMDAEPARIRIRTSYNLAAFSFTPEELAAEIKEHVPAFTCSYRPDERQNIADSWPKTIDDSEARNDWAWKPKYDMPSMTKSMLDNLSKRLSLPVK